jgi:hypothetical protein
VVEPDNVRVEELPSHAYGSDGARPAAPSSKQYDEEVAQGYRVLQPLRRHRPTEDEIAHRDRSRYAVWDQARRDYRSGIARPPAPVTERVYETDVPPATRILVPLDPPVYSSAPSGHAQVSSIAPQRTSHEV